MEASYPVKLGERGAPKYKHCPNFAFSELFSNAGNTGLYLFTNIANQKCVRYSVIKQSVCLHYEL